MMIKSFLKRMKKYGDLSGWDRYRDSSWCWAATGISYLNRTATGNSNLVGAATGLS